MAASNFKQRHWLHAKEIYQNLSLSHTELGF
jgi:hypothetical protein